MAKIINLETGKKEADDIESCDDCGWTMFNLKIVNDIGFCTIQMTCSKCGELYHLVVPIN